MKIWLGAAIALLLCGPAAAQLVVVHADYVVTRVDRNKHQFVVIPSDTLNRDAEDMRGHFDVELTPKTQVVDHDGHPINWQSLHPGMTVHVDGGLRMDVRITAQKIVVEGD
ncbi:MAG TPA: hypothetical protein VGO93_08290 [Candidatus Xenobia bacterium]|jgi:hypothetical protein